MLTHHPAAPPWDAPAVVSTKLGALTVHAVRSGFVACKEAHRTLSGPEALRTVAIALDRRWTEWMPILVYVIEHPEGVILVDAGQLERTGDARSLDCDPMTRWFYRNQLRLAFRPEERIDRRLMELGVDPRRVTDVVLTHRHADHADGVTTLPASARIHVGEGDWPWHQGALPAHWPRDRTPTLVGASGAPCDAFSASASLVPDGSVRVVSLPGHSPGHLAVWATTEDGLRLLFAGDATFSLGQVETRTIAGICERPREARASLEALRAQLMAHPTVLLPAHEPAALQRLASPTPTTLSR